MVDLLLSNDNTVIEPFDPVKDFLVTDAMAQFIVVFEDRINELMWDISKDEKAKTKKIGSVRLSRNRLAKPIKPHIGKGI